VLLLTDVDGFFVPKGRKKPRLQRVVRKLTAALEAQCNGKSKLGRGGMISKLRAAKLASEAGVHVAIVNGRHPRAIAMALRVRLEHTFLHRAREMNYGFCGYYRALHAGKMLRARAATTRLAQLSTEAKNALLFAMADAVEANRDGFWQQIVMMWRAPASPEPCATVCC